MAGFMNKLTQMWSVPDDEYEEIEQKTAERPAQEERVSRRSARAERAPRSERSGRSERAERSERLERAERAPLRDASYDREYEREQSVPEYSAPRRLHVAEPSESKVVNIHATTQLQVVVYHPERFGEETRNIADELLKMHTVVLNLEQTDREHARRIVDFLSGVAYSNGGKIKRIATDTFIITPYNVDLMGDNVLDELENSGVYF